MTSSPSPSPSLDLAQVSFFGRALSEYQLFFDIRASDYVGHRVLDVAAGPSSFVAEAASCGIDAVATDPLYRYSESALRLKIQTDFTRMFARIRANASFFTLKTFTSIDAAEADRRRATERFLADFYPGVGVGRYLAASLPSLPFAPATFDLVLCGHLLFVYESLFDLDFHIAACRELVRVSRGEVRIHPLVNLAGEPSSYVNPVRDALAVHGIESTIIDVDYAFFRNTSKTMVLTRR